VRYAAFLAFFFSGASSLIFQSIWSRMLAHVFGASGVAISTTVTVFMAGLGLGAFFAGRYADRIKHPVITYAVVEGLVGLWALLLPTLLDPEGWLAGVNAWLRNDVGSNSAVLMALVRFLCVVPILLIPTTLMGSSLPLLSRHFVQQSQDAGKVGSWVGALYSVNTFGAVAGVGLGAFLLMPNIGVTWTNAVAAGMNFALFAAIFAFRKQLLPGWKKGDKLEFLPTKKTEPEEEPEKKPAETPSEDDEKLEKKTKKRKKKKAAKKAESPYRDHPDPDPDPDAIPRDDDAFALPVPRIARHAAFAAFAISGLAALCYEVVWSRALAMTIGSSFQAFSLILMTFLIGIGGGSAVASGVITRHRMFGATAIASIVLTFLANAQWGAEDGVLMWLIVSVVFCLPIVVIWGAVQARGKSQLVPTAPVVPALLTVIVPALAATLNGLLVFPGTLGTVVGAVTACISGFLAVCVVLRRYPVLQLAVMPLFIGVAAFVNYLYQDAIPCAFVELLQSLGGSFADHVGLVQFFMFLTTMLCTLPATLGMGAMFPLTLRVWTSGGASVGKDVGNVYAGNTIGSVVGAWLPGFVLMQLFGMQKTILVGMFVYLGIALMMLIVSAAERTEGEGKLAKVVEAPPWYAVTIYVLAPLIPALFVGLWFGGWRDDGPLRWNRSQMTLGVFRVSLADDACSPDWGEPDLVYYHDGLSTTVSVERWGRHYALKNNGKVDASNGDDMPTQIMVGAYPLLMHEEGPEDLDVAIVGFGSGVTVGTVLKFPVASVDVMELERAIPEASRFFQDVNGLDYTLPEFPYIEMDRLDIVNDDGRNYLASTDQQYDVIISEPSNPWITGVSDLFTTDHWRITKQRLRDGGIYCQWVQLYELSPENIKTIYRTFASQFEHVIVFAAEDLSSDTVMLGSDSPLPLDLERVQRTYQIPGVADELERAYIHSPFDVFARVLMADKEEVLQFAQIEHRLRGGEWLAFPDSNNDPERGCAMPNCRREPVVLNTDDNAHIEFAAPRDLIGYQRFEGYLANIYAQDWPYGHITDHATGFGEGEEAARHYAEMAMSLIAHGKKTEAAAFITRSSDAGRSRETLIAAEVLRRLMSSENEPTVHIEPPVPGPQLAAREARTLTEGFAAVRQAVDMGNHATALAAMEDIPAPLRLHSGPGLRLLYAYLLFKTAHTYQSRYREAIDHLEDLLRSEPDYVTRHPEIFYFLGRAHDAELNFDKGMRNMRIYVEARLRALEEAPPEDAPTTDATDEEDGDDESGRNKLERPEAPDDAPGDDAPDEAEGSAPDEVDPASAD